MNQVNYYQEEYKPRSQKKKDNKCLIIEDMELASPDPIDSGGSKEITIPVRTFGPIAYDEPSSAEGTSASSWNDHCNVFEQIPDMDVYNEYLIIYIKSNDISEVEKIVPFCDINKPDSEEHREPIFWALNLRHLDIARILIRNYCKLDVLNEDGCSPIHICLRDNELHVLLQDIWSRSLTSTELECKTKQGNTPLHLATEENDIDSINNLLLLSANINTKTYYNGETALHIACRSSTLDIVTTLLSYDKIDVNIQDKQSNTPLHCAMKRSNADSSLQVITDLLEHSANPDLTNKFARKPLDEGFHLGPEIYKKVAKEIENFNPISKSWKWEIDPNNLIEDHDLPIGKGGFGVVFRGRLFGTDCAVKKIKPSKESTIDQINHEIGVMGDTHHPNLVSLLGTCRKDGFVYIITEFIDNGCLREYLKKGENPCTVKMIISMSTDISRGMAWLHSRKPPIFHRDLHSRNVLVTSKGICKVGDFGLTHVKGEIFQSTRLYKRIIPPELIGSEFSNYSAPADVYMFGLVLYELITRLKAAGSDIVIEELRSLVVDNMQDLVDLLADCISRNPQKRPTFEEIIKRLNLKNQESQYNPTFEDDESPFLPVMSLYVNEK